MNLDEDGGYKRKIQDIAKKGNLGVFHQVQEVPDGQVFYGAIFGFNPFVYAKQDKLVIRVGLHRNGMILLEKDANVNQVRLNAATAALFQRDLSVERYCLHGLQLSPWYSLDDAVDEVVKWV